MQGSFVVIIGTQHAQFTWYGHIPGWYTGEKNCQCAQSLQYSSNMKNQLQLLKAAVADFLATK
jgi:hypothetical protein